MVLTLYCNNPFVSEQDLACLERILLSTGCQAVGSAYGGAGAAQSVLWTVTGT